MAIWKSSFLACLGAARGLRRTADVVAALRRRATVVPGLRANFLTAPVSHGDPSTARCADCANQQNVWLAGARSVCHVHP